MYDRSLIQSHFHLKLSSETPEEKGDNMECMLGMAMQYYPLMPYFLWERVAPQHMTFEQLMPKPKLLHWLHWLHAHFLKLALPHPRPQKDYTLVYAPLNLTVFLRLVAHVAQLGYPAHWLSALLTALLEGSITTTARAPRRLVLLRKDVDAVHPARKLCTKPWALELSVLVSLWQRVLPFGLVAPGRLIPRTQGIEEYTVELSALHSEVPHVPHFMLVFYDETTFGKPPAELRSLLLDGDEGAGSASLRAKRERGIHVLTTFQWSAKENSATFWMDRESFEKMVEGNWRLYVWRTDTWGRESAGLELQTAVVQKKIWEVWTAAAGCSS